MEQAAADNINGDDLLSRIVDVLKTYLELEEHEYLAIGLWIMHTYVFDMFMNSPRLALLSPVRGCGKTVLLSVLKVLCASAVKTDNLTASALFRLIDQNGGSTTVLCDEVDNQNLAGNNVLLSVINGGHRRGGTTLRVVKGVSTEFATYAPMALAAIGTLPLPTIHRSVVIRLTRSDGSRPLKRFDDAKTTDFDAICRDLCVWAQGASLHTDPELPIKNRPADNWRVLVSIADSCGEEWGAKARGAAVVMSDGFQDEDPGVVLLQHIQQVFDQLHTKRDGQTPWQRTFMGVEADRIPSAALVEELLAIEDSPWNEWRGPKNDQPARKLSQGELARLLSLFGIRRPRTIWPLRRTSESKSAKGYFKSDFEPAWKAYCQPEDGTPSQQPEMHLIKKRTGS